MRYVITLDRDTQLPRDSARECAGAMAHPLNRPRYDAASGRVIEGYGILQPRVGVSLPASNRSLYARLFGSDPGVDPYTRAVSDVYQDLFHEGSYIGKGIYDVEAFGKALEGRFPENRILSHDLLEGSYARAGLLTDVLFYEEYPTSYSTDVTRRHRWIRGDWQLVGWLLPRVPGPQGRRRNPLTGLHRWKLFDNLRRSLVPVAATVLLLMSWSLLAPSWLWTFGVLGVLILPSLIAALREFFRVTEDMSLWQHLNTSTRAAAGHLSQAAFIVATLPYEAFVSADAIVRTLGRMLLTRRRLLEWNASSDIERTGSADLRLVHPENVAGAGDRAGDPAGSRHRPARNAAACLPGARAVAGVAGHRVVDVPAASRPGGRAHRRADQVPPRAGAADLGLLRDLRGRRGQLAAARQLSGRSRAGGGAPHLAHQHGHGAAGQPRGL